MSEPQTPRKARPAVARVLIAALAFQAGIAALLVLGDMQQARFDWPGFGPEAPRLTERVAPGDQRRRFRPGRDRPATQPARDPGDLPPRLVLTAVDGATYRLEGTIAEGDGARVIALLREADPRPAQLILQSPGGSVDDALTLGRHLREERIETRMLAGEYCFSACPYVLVGGEGREIDEEALVGVHQHYFGESTILPASFAVEDIQAGQAEVMTYLHAMGIDPLLMRHALTTPPDEIYILLPEELRRYGFLPGKG